MITCKNCGAELEDDVKFCPSCGTKIQVEQQSPAGESAQAEENAQTDQKQTDFSAKLSALNNTKDSTADFDPKDIEQNKGMAILAYLSWLVLIPLFGAKESKFARFHVNQGIVLAIVETVWWIFEAILTSVCYIIAWALGVVVSLLLGIVNLAFFVLLIVGIMNAANGKAKELPVIGKYTIIK